MKYSILLSLFFLACSTTVSAKELKTVKHVNFERYQGTWNQLAAIPASFQRDCVANTTAQYTILADEDLIKVVNSCKKKNGKIKSSEARARINPDFDQNSKLEVTFVKIFGWVWALGGDYWITYLDDNYQIAIVGSPDYKFGWILARQTSLSKKTYKKLSQVLTKRGYDPCKFIMSRTTGQNIQGAQPLCDYVN